MKKIWMIAVVACAALMIACGASTDELAESVRGDLKRELEKSYSDVNVDEVVLVHKGGNEYDGVVNVKADGMDLTYSLDVIFDGEAYTLEYYEML